MFAPGSAKPERIVGIPLSASAGTIGSVPPLRMSSGRRPSTRSNASWRVDGRRVRRDEAGGRGRPAFDLEVGARGRRLAQEALEMRIDLLDVLSRGEPDRDVRLRLDRQDRLLQVRLADRDPVDVDGRARERARVELLGSGLVGRPGAGLASTASPESSSSQERRSSSVGSIPRPGAPRASRSPRRACCMSACAAFSAAPPKTPECRSRSPVRRRTWK